MKFWWAWPSWVVELVGGLLFVGIFVVPVPLIIKLTIASLGYELALDQNGWSLKDVLQRQVGILLGVAVVAWLTTGSPWGIFVVR